VLAIQAQQHGLRAADLDLLGEQRLVDALRVVRLVEPAGEVLAELVEAHRLALGATAPRGEQVVDGDAVGPRREPGVAAERAQARDELDQDLLRGVLGVGGMPEHAQRERVDRVLHGAQERLQGGAVAAPGALDRPLVYSGHEASAIALSTVSSWPSASILASKTSSGSPGSATIVNVCRQPPSTGTVRV
jgi:hypothetical protein